MGMYKDIKEASDKEQQLLAGYRECGIEMLNSPHRIFYGMRTQWEGPVDEVAPRKRSVSTRRFRWTAEIRKHRMREDPQRKARMKAAQVLVDKYWENFANGS